MVAEGSRSMVLILSSCHSRFLSLFALLSCLTITLLTRRMATEKVDAMSAVTAVSPSTASVGSWRSLSNVYVFNSDIKP